MPKHSRRPSAPTFDSCTQDQSPTPDRGHRPAPAPFYANCTGARAVGAVPLYKRHPGYSSKLNRGGDEVVCEK